MHSLRPPNANSGPTATPRRCTSRAVTRAPTTGAPLAASSTPGGPGCPTRTASRYSELEVPGPALGYHLDDGAEFFLLATSDDRTQDRLRVGEALSSVLLTATGAGLATTPLSRGTDLETHRDMFHQSRRTANPQIFVRVGWPTNAEQSPSARRDLATVLVRPVDSTGEPPVESDAGVWAGIIR